MKYTVINSGMEKFGPYTFTEIQNWLAKYSYRISVADTKDFVHRKNEWLATITDAHEHSVAYEHSFRIENRYGEVLPKSYFQKLKKVKPYFQNTGRKRRGLRSRHSKVHKLIKDTFIDPEYGYMIPAKSKAKAYYVAGSWDAPFRNVERNWKSYRRTQYKVINM